MTIALLQPIEVHAGNDRSAWTVGGVGPTNIDMTIGSYGCVLSMIRGLQNLLVAAFAGNAPIVYLGVDHHVRIYSAQNLTVTFTDIALGRLLGFRADIPFTAGPVTVTATDTPQRCWFPEFVTENRHRWRRDQERAFAGSQAHDGTLAGVEVGPEVYKHHLVFQDVRSYSALVEAQQDSYAWGGTTYYPHEERAWETFYHSVRTSVTVNDPAPGVTGMYYLPDIGVWETADPVGSPITYPATMDSGGIRYELTTTPDTYTFTHTTPSPPPEPTESLDGSIYYYRLEIDMLTAPAPAWDAP